MNSDVPSSDFARVHESFVARPIWPECVKNWQCALDVFCVAADHEAVSAFCAAHKMKIVGEIPYDPGLADAERAGQPPLDFSPDTPSVTAMRKLAADLIATG